MGKKSKKQNENKAANQAQPNALLNADSVDNTIAVDLEPPPRTAASAFVSTILPPVPTEAACEGDAVGQVVGSCEVPFQETRMQDTFTYPIISFQSITAMPQYQEKSFEELRLEDYMAGNMGSQVVGSREVPFQETRMQDTGGTYPIVSCQSITAMSQYQEKSFEELRLEDYMAGNMGSQVVESHEESFQEFRMKAIMPFEELRAEEYRGGNTDASSRYDAHSYRMDEQSYYRLQETLDPLVAQHFFPNRGDNINTRMRLSIALGVFAGGSPYDIMVSHGVSFTSILTSVRGVVDCMNRCPDLEVTFPTHEELN